LAIVCLLLAFVIKQSSSNLEVAKLVTNKQCPSDQLMALTYYAYLCENYYLEFVQLIYVKNYYSESKIALNVAIE